MMTNLSTSDKKWLQWVVLLIVMGILLIVGSAVFGASLFDDDFEEYSLGNINNQYDWHTPTDYRPNYYFDISDDVSCPSERCLFQHGSPNADLWKNQDVATSGSFIWSMNPAVVGTQAGTYWAFGLGDFRTSRALSGDDYCASIEMYATFETTDLQIKTNNSEYSTTGIYLSEGIKINLGFEWDFSASKQIRFFLINNWTEWFLCNGYTDTGIYGFTLVNASGGDTGVEIYLDDFRGAEPHINITYPESESEMTDAFTMEIDYDLRGEDFDRLVIGFSDWDASSTCPEIDDADYQEQRDLYFNNSSMLYFSEYLTGTSTGSTTLEVFDIETGIYNCNMCRFYNETTGAMSERLCRGYLIKILEYIPPADVPTFYLPISDWADYYAEHSERFATSTPIFNSMAETFSPLIIWVGNTIIFFNEYFDPEEAGNRGEEIGNAVSTARGYLESIDDFFGGLPISTIFIFYLITAIVVIIYRLVRGILTIIIP